MPRVGCSQLPIFRAAKSAFKKTAAPMKKMMHKNASNTACQTSSSHTISPSAGSMSTSSKKWSASVASSTGTVVRCDLPGDETSTLAESEYDANTFVPSDYDACSSLEFYTPCDYETSTLAESVGTMSSPGKWSESEYEAPTRSVSRSTGTKIRMGMRSATSARTSHEEGSPRIISRSAGINSQMGMRTLSGAEDVIREATEITMTEEHQAERNPVRSRLLAKLRQKKLKLVSRIKVGTKRRAGHLTTASADHELGREDDDVSSYCYESDYSSLTFGQDAKPQRVSRVPDYWSILHIERTRPHRGISRDQTLDFNSGPEEDDMTSVVSQTAGFDSASFEEDGMISLYELAPSPMFFDENADLQQVSPVPDYGSVLHVERTRPRLIISGVRLCHQIISPAPRSEAYVARRRPRASEIF